MGFYHDISDVDTPQALVRGRASENPCGEAVNQPSVLGDAVSADFSIPGDLQEGLQSHAGGRGLGQQVLDVTTSRSVPPMAIELMRWSKPTFGLEIRSWAREPSGNWALSQCRG